MNEKQMKRFSEASSRIKAMTVTRAELNVMLNAFMSDSGDTESGMIAALESIGFIVEPEPLDVPESVYEAASRAVPLGVSPGRIESIVRAALDEAIRAGIVTRAQ